MKFAHRLKTTKRPSRKQLVFMPTQKLKGLLTLPFGLGTALQSYFSELWLPVHFMHSSHLILVPGTQKASPVQNPEVSDWVSQQQVWVDGDGQRLWPVSRDGHPDTDSVLLTSTVSQLWTRTLYGLFGGSGGICLCVQSNPLFVRLPPPAYVFQPFHRTKQGTDLNCDASLMSLG